MEISYWKSRWKKGRTGWHMQQVYPPLKTYWQQLQLVESAVVFVPLCGKSLDLQWLMEQGHNVIGVEVSEQAVRHFFKEHDLSYRISTKAGFSIYNSDHITLWAGNFFKLTPSFLPPVDAIYDKAALIALPRVLRKTYATHVLRFCTPYTQILLNTFEYEQEEMTGPPFAVFPDELQLLYGHRFSITQIHEESIFEDTPQFKSRGLSSYLLEKVYHLTPYGV